LIGAKDSFFLFLHWLRSANPIDQTAAHFDLRSPKLYKHLHKLALAVHDPLVTKYITGLREQPLRVTGSDYRSYGLVVDATVQKPGRPAASFEEARRYFSGKHWIYCLKSQVVTNRQGLELHVVAGLPGSVRDLMLLRLTVTELEELVASKPNEPTKILADNGYTGFTDSQILQSMTLYKKPRNGVLSQAQLAVNTKLGSARVIIENYFGRFSNRFLIMVRRWGFEDQFYSAIFKICCALANSDILAGEGESLRMQEGDEYGVILTRICTKGKRAVEDARERMKRR
jgi:hypothetical protein